MPIDTNWISNHVAPTLPKIPLTSFNFHSIFLSHDKLQESLSEIMSAAPITALAIGIGLTIFGSCVMTLGSLITKLAIHRESKRLQRDVHIPVMSHLWWSGNS